jgi:hypothetical protein
MLKLQPTIRVRSNSHTKLEYQILKFDPVTFDSVPLDLTGLTVNASLIPDESASYVVDGRNCALVDEADGVVSCEFSSAETATPGMYQLKFDVINGEYVTHYPANEYQWVLIF